MEPPILSFRPLAEDAAPERYVRPRSIVAFVMIKEQQDNPAVLARRDGVLCWVLSRMLSSQHDALDRATREMFYHEVRGLGLAFRGLSF